MADKNMFKKSYLFYGKDCDMVNKLVSVIDNESGTAIFSSLIELFMIAALIGVTFDVKCKPDKDKSRNKTIFADQLTSRTFDLNFIFRIVMLLGDRLKLDDVTRLNKAFRNPDTDENYQEFEEYMLGGVNFLYDKLMVDSNKDFKDYLTSVNRLIDECNNNESDFEEKTPDSKNLFDGII